MIALGLRAHPKHVTFAVVDNPDSPRLVALSEIRLPAALHAPEQLFYVRTTLLDLIQEFGISSTGVRTTEPVADRPSLLRVNIEGVIQELLGAGAVPRYFAGPLATIGKHLGVTTKDAKRMATGEADVVGVDRWRERFNDEEREAVLAALAALRIPKSRLSMMMIGDAPIGSTPTVAGADGASPEEKANAD